MGLEDKRKFFWSRMEKQYGVPFSKPFRSKFDNDDEYELFKHYDEDEGRDEMYFESVELEVEDFVDTVNLFAGHEINSSSIESTPCVKGKRGKRYNKCFDRRSYLVRFVIGEKGGVNQRAKWKQIASNWNKANPSDQQTPLVLKAEYYRAVKEDPRLSQVLTKND